jgi:hypothetical protein
VAVKYFGGPGPERVFERYASMHGVSVATPALYETIATCLFAQDASTKSGYNVLLETHRSGFNGLEPTDQICEMTSYRFESFDALVEVLTAEKAIALVCVNPNTAGDDLHSVAVAVNTDGAAYKNDTNHGAPERIATQTDLWADHDSGSRSIGDVLMLKQRSPLLLNLKSSVAGSLASPSAT